MTKSELKDIIKECVEEILTESNRYNWHWQGKQKTDTSAGLKERLIEVAKHNKFTKKENDFYKKNFLVDDIDKYDCGYCWGDAAGNPIVYSFSKNKFYFIDHESFDGMSDAQVSIKWIKDYIEREEK